MDNKINNDIDVEEINGIKNEISLSPTEIKADLTKTINEAYKDSLKPALQETGKGLKFCFQFLASKVKPYMYESIEEAKYKCREIDIKLEEKYNKIPKENRVQPRTSIVGPTLDILKYNLDEEHIKEIFINLLSSEMDGRKQNGVLPAYINIINQLSYDDAIFLKQFKDNNTISFCTSKLISKVQNYVGIKSYTKFMIRKNKNNLFTTSMLNELTLDNLTRLNILKVDYDNYYTSKKEEYDTLNKYILNLPITQILQKENPNCIFECNNGIIELTFFGKKFIDICLS